MCIVICNVVGLCIDSYSYKTVQIPHPWTKLYNL